MRNSSEVATTAEAPETPANAADDETCDEWFARFNEHQRALEQYGTRSQWRTWISPRIGGKRWRDVTSDDVEDIRDALDEAIRRWHIDGPGRGRITGQTAMGVWWALRGALREAATSKRRDLRVLTGMPNPALDVQPPGDRRSRRHRSRSFIYPREFDRLVRSPHVPVVWRTAHALAAYTFVRPGELRALRWTDVDLEHGLIRITRAWSYVDRSPRFPKSAGGVRDVPIAPSLAPVLRRMQRRATSALVVPVLATVPIETLAARTRKHLGDAGILRDVLHVSSRTTLRASFRSWRDSGITWTAMSGLDTTKIMRRAGHDDIASTVRYVRQAEDIDGELGEPFGALPDDLGRT